MEQTRPCQNNRKAIVVGASSGIGEALAKVLGRNGYEVGLAARRLELLGKLQQELSVKTYIKQIDISRTNQAMALLGELIREMNGLDLLVINSGINTRNLNLDWEKENRTIGVNIAGFAAMANVGVKYFLAQGSGHLVGISSIAGLRGSPTSTSYSASKAFVSNYLQGLRYGLKRDNIYITDIRPGLVDTDMIRGEPGLFWVAAADQAAEQIYQAISRKKKIAYITRRWRIIAWLLKVLPERGYASLYKSGYGKDGK